MIMHPFSSAQYMREVTLPAINQGLAASERTLDGFELDYAPMTATATTEEGMEAALQEVRGRIAFYGCTVAYKPVLEQHGWGDLQDELINLNRQHRTQEMAELITDEMVDTIAVVGSPEHVVDEMRSRFGGVITRTGFAPSGLEPDHLQELLGRLKG